MRGCHGSAMLGWVATERVSSCGRRQPANVACLSGRFFRLVCYSNLAAASFERGSVSRTFPTRNLRRHSIDSITALPAAVRRQATVAPKLPRTPPASLFCHLATCTNGAWSVCERGDAAGMHSKGMFEIFSTEPSLATTHPPLKESSANPGRRLRFRYKPPATDQG